MLKFKWELKFLLQITDDLTSLYKQIQGQSPFNMNFYFFISKECLKRFPLGQVQKRFTESKLYQ